MNATVIKTNKGKAQSITGQVIQRGLNKITLAVTDKKGSKSIKSFNESIWIVRVQSC
jgi:hypothetical protein